MTPDSSHIFPLLYAGPISYYSYWVKFDRFIDAHENFQKQTFRNRAKIYGANGPITLTVPVKSGSQKIKITDVEISNIESWQRDHWKTLVSAYQASPFFEYYAFLLEPIFQKRYDSLWKFNMDIHHVILRCLQLPVQEQFTPSFHPIDRNDLRAIYTSKKPHPQSATFPKYQQVFSYDKPFISDLSIFDALFNLGPETEDYLLKLNLSFT